MQIINEMIMKNNVCPVCGNQAVGDYYHDSIVCTICGSDLSVFRTLQKEKNSKQRGIILMLTGFIVILALAMVLAGSIVNKRNAKMIAEKEATITRLQNDVHDLTLAVSASSESDNAETPEEGSFVYTIRRGDSFCSISRRFYGTENYYKELAKDNGLGTESHLRVGQKLIIKSR